MRDRDHRDLRGLIGALVAGLALAATPLLALAPASASASASAAVPVAAPADDKPIPKPAPVEPVDAGPATPYEGTAVDTVNTVLIQGQRFVNRAVGPLFERPER
jgi:hypothetical protein